MLAPRRGCLGYSKVYCDVRKRWLLTWNQNRHITYYIFHIKYTNSEISIGLLYIRPPLRLMTPTLSLRGLSPLFSDFHFGPCLCKFLDIPYVKHLGDVMVYEFRAELQSRFQKENLSISTLSSKAFEQHRSFSVTV